MSARVDPSRSAHVQMRTPLLYRDGPDAALDRPGHVRAGSGLVALGSGHLAVVQDDACFLAIIDLRSGAVHDVPFPLLWRRRSATEGVQRQFDDTRGNKKQKLDLEAVFVTPDGLLVALGSGSSPLREHVVLVDEPASGAPHVSIVHAPELYARLRAERSFSGSELNVEGAAIVGDDVLLFQRGNGAPALDIGTSHSRPALATRGELAPVDATARLALTPLLAYLHGKGPLPPLRDVVRWDLGSADGHRLSFTDGAVHPHGVVAFLACAEDSPDATRDGPVSAVMLGCLDEGTRSCELGVILDERGAPLLDKAEGLAFDLADASRAFVVTDRDDPAAPSELLELRLGDAWHASSSPVQRAR
jgi:hypothetical protein